MRPLDNAEPGQSIADVLPDDLRHTAPNPRTKPHECPDCEACFADEAWYEQHRDRDHCLGHVPDNALTTSVTEDGVTIHIQEGGS